MPAEAVVVTGAGGFIGHHLAAALARSGHRVSGVDRRFETGEDLPFRAVRADFRDERTMAEVLAGATVLFHLAAAHLQVSLPEAEYWDINVHGLRPLVRLARAAGVSRVVHVSSVGVYGDVGPVPATEATPARPLSLYGRTKLEGERTILEAGRAEGVDVVVVRPAWVYGPGCPRTARLCRALSRRRFLMIGRGTNLRHPIYINDMVDALRLAATVPGARGEVLIAAGDRAVTTRELVETICDVFAFPAPALRVPYALGAAAAALIEAVSHTVGVEPPVSRRTLEFFGTDNAFDTSRARAILGFVPRFDLRAGLIDLRNRMPGGAPGARTCAA